MVSASVSTSPPSITLVWPSAAATSYTVRRKTLADTSWILLADNLPGTTTTYTDTDVSVSSAYEYYVYKDASVDGYGYIYAGIQVPLTEGRGTLLLLVDNRFTTPLTNELTQLERDLAGDGWKVIRHDVSTNTPVSDVKALIMNDYNADPSGVQAVFLFGHIPQPYSGVLAPDGHTGHLGAWPADVYYGDIDGTWTDRTVNYTNTTVRQQNVPGDGKFDQTTIPSDLELQVGRVDLYNMPAFALSETELLRQYLSKDHKFRRKLFTAQERGLVDDNFGYFYGEAFAASGWRAGAAFFGASSVYDEDFFSTLKTNASLFSYGCGGGSFTSVSGVGNTTDFSTNEVHSVFTLFFGSYFGDWDYKNSFLRAPLASSPWALTCAWSGRPNWYMHHMALGLPIGYSARMTQNHTGYLYLGSGSYNRFVHIGLMGDPTLRLQPVAPPSQISTATNASGNVVLNWTASAETVAGYHVYRSPSVDGPYTRLNPTLEPGTLFTDSAPLATTNFYMVRAVKLQTSGSGTYYNPSQGTFGAYPDRRVTLTVDSACGSPAPAAGTNNYSWYDATVLCGLSNSIVEQGTTQRVVIGWSGTGDVLGSGTDIEPRLINLTQNSSITWLWQTSFWLHIATEGEGTVDQSSGWYRADTPVTLTASGNAFYNSLFSHWSGDVPEGMEHTNPLEIPFASASEITAVFIASANPDNSLPFVETFEAYPPDTWLPGTNGWHAATWTAATVSTNSEIISGILDYGLTQPYPVNTTHNQTGMITNDASLCVISSSNSIVTTKMLIKMNPTPTDYIPNPSTLTYQMACLFSEDGYFQLWHGTPVTGTKVWSTFTGTIYNTNEWHSLTLENDYATSGQGSRYFRISIDNGPWLTHADGYTANDGTGSSGGAWFAIADTTVDHLTVLSFSGNLLVDDILIGESWSGQGGSGDLNNNGIWDLWEVQYFGGTNTPAGSATADPDGDGADNRSEYLADTDPGDITSILAIDGIVCAPGGVQIFWQGGRLANQYLEYSEDLCSGIWQAIFTNPPPTDTFNETIDTNPATRQRFYRIRANRE